MTLPTVSQPDLTNRLRPVFVVPDSDTITPSSASNNLMMFTAYTSHFLVRISEVAAVRLHVDVCGATDDEIMTLTDEQVAKLKDDAIKATLEIVMKGGGIDETIHIESSHQWPIDKVYNLYQDLIYRLHYQG